MAGQTKELTLTVLLLQERINNAKRESESMYVGKAAERTAYIRGLDKAMNMLVAITSM